METKFNFNSQICTTKEQSERLLALGLKKETADMWYPHFAKTYPIPLLDEVLTTDDIPAWSLGRLVENLMPKTITYRLNDYYLSLDIGEGFIGYFPPRLNARAHALEYFYGNDTILDDCISCIEWLIKDGYFNKEYLV